MISIIYKFKKFLKNIYCHLQKNFKLIKINLKFFTILNMYLDVIFKIIKNDFILFLKIKFYIHLLHFE